MALSLASCDGKPDGWATIDGGLLASLTSKKCPDLTGTYRLHPRDEGNGNVMSVAIFVPRLPAAQRAVQWETMTISGDPKTSLVATFARSAETVAALHARLQESDRKHGVNRIAAENYKVMFSPEGRRLPRFAQMSDDEYERYLQQMFPWPTSTVTVQYGVHYTCSGGWIEDIVSIEGAPGQREDGKPVQRYSVSVKLARDKAGDLVAQNVSMVRKELTLWCGDGCKGIPLGMWKEHAWGRWASDKPAWTGPMPRPWAVKIPHAVPAPIPEPKPAIVRMELSAGNLPGRLRPLLPAGVRVGLVGVTGTRYRFTVYADSQAQVADLLRNLDRSSVFASPELESIAKNASGQYEAKITAADKAAP